MPSMKPSALLTMFAGVSFADLRRAAANQNASGAHGQPSLHDVALATRFAGPAQVAFGGMAIDNASGAMANADRSAA